MKNTSGPDFEIYVESLYQGLGFSTKRNVNIFGQQIDIIAKRSIKGSGDICLLIECKYLSSGNVSNQDVYDYASVINTLKYKYPLTKGVIITNANFTQDANSAADNNFMLLTVQELENEYFEVKDSYRKLVNEYESEGIFLEYIPLSAETHFAQVEDVEELIVNNILCRLPHLDSFFYSILGDYGSGKSTLQKRLLYRFSKLYLENKSTLKPFYLELKNYHKFKNIELFIIANYQKQFQKEITYKAFAKELANRGFLILLDGFDEMSPQVNKEKRIEDFNIISGLLFSNSHCILTCRPSYFVSKHEYNEFIENKVSKKRTTIVEVDSKKLTFKARQESINHTYKKLRDVFVDKSDNTNLTTKDITSIALKEFSDDQILSYLGKFQNQFLTSCETTSKEVKLFLDDIYDLSELMSKPLLLSMIKETILSHGVYYQKFRSDYGPAFLYELYTEINLELDWNKGDTRQFMTPKERGEFASAIALSMFEASTLEVDYKTILNAIHNYKTNLANISKVLQDADPETIASDVQICSFITRTDDKQFRFVHTSFMEFFVAKYLVEIFKNGSIEEKFKSILLKPEILLFIGSFCLNNESLRETIMNFLKLAKNEIERRNLSIVYIYTQPDHDFFNLANANINNASFSKISFKQSAFTTVLFNKIRLKKMSFEETTFNNVSFVDSELHDLKFLDSRGLLHFTTTTGTNLQLSRANYSYLITFEVVSLVLHSITATNLRIDIFYLNLSILDSKFSNCKLKFDYLPSENDYSGSHLEFSDVEFYNCEILGSIQRVSGKLKIQQGLLENLNLSGSIDRLELKILDAITKDTYLKNCSLKIEGSKSHFINVDFDNCNIKTSEVDSVIFEKCKFNSVSFARNRDKFNCEFKECTFKTAKIEAVSVSNMNQNKFDSDCQGLFVSNDTTLLQSISEKKEKISEYFIPLGSKLYIISDDDLRLNKKIINDKLKDLELL